MATGLSPREQFLREMAGAQDEQLSGQHGVAQQQLRLRQRLDALPRRRPALWGALAATAVAAAAAIFLLWPTPLTFSVGEVGARGQLGAAVAAPAASPLDLTFSDGSFVALGPNGRARVTSIDARGAAVLVERGHADVAIVPRKSGSWRVDAGPFQIHVKGTRFSFDWDPALEQLDFRLHHGAVVITASCLPGGRSLVAGQSLQASCRLPAAPAPSAAAAPVAPATTASNVPGVAPAPSVAGSPSWRQLAAKQDYRAALSAAIRSGFSDECARATPSDLLLLGDVARLAGDPARAVQAYETARRKQAAPNRSAFALGLVEFEQRGNYARAAEWFATYVREQPSGPLVEDAYGRQLDAWQRAGNRARAQQISSAYLARYPSGQYADLARRLARSE